MKKIALLTALFLGIASIANSQEENDNREKLVVGLKAGLNYSNVYDERGDEFRADAKFGFAGGVFLEIPLGKYVGIQPEALISQKGFRGRGTILGTTYDFTRTTTSVDLPLQFQLKPSEFFSIVVGPQYSFLIHQRDVFANATTTIEQEKEFMNDNIRKNVLGLVGGFDINIRHFTFGARLGCDVQNNHGDGTSSTPRYKNVWYQGTVGFKLYRQD